MSHVLVINHSAMSVMYPSVRVPACEHMVQGRDSVGGSRMAFMINGTVVNLVGSNGGLILRDNLTNNLPVNANGTFTFTETVASGAAWADVINQNGVYGTLGALAPGNVPGARCVANSWVDANGNLWLFVGYGFAGGTGGYLGDLWMYML
jgi:hypothetical protein